MKYLMLIYGNTEIWGSLAPEDFSAFVGRVDAFNQELRDSGEMVAVDGLAAPVRSVRSVDGTHVVSDGPYLEAKEHVGSYTVIDVESEERALELARSYPGILPGGGGLELWPLMGHGGGDV